MSPRPSSRAVGQRGRGAEGQRGRSSFGDLKSFRARGQRSRDTILQTGVMLSEMTWLGQHPGKKNVDIRATWREAEIATGPPGVRMEDSEPRDCMSLALGPHCSLTQLAERKLKTLVASQEGRMKPHGLALVTWPLQALQPL